MVVSRLPGLDHRISHHFRSFAPDLFADDKLLPERFGASSIFYSTR